MTNEQVLAAVLGGSLIVVGEYRMVRAETPTLRDKKTGQKRLAVLAKHTVELGDNRSIEVGTWHPDGAKSEDVKPLVPKGTRVVVHVQSWVIDKGLVSCGGRIEPLNGQSPASSPVGSSKVGKTT